MHHGIVAPARLVPLLHPEGKFAHAQSAMQAGSGDHIHIEQLEISARVGVPATERENPQRLTVNLTLWPARGLFDLKDDIRRTVDYAAVCEETKKIAREQASRLVETLADRVAVHLLRVFTVRKITVEVRKFVLPDAAYVSVTVTRGVRAD
jgi:FolB domain-containing protein